mmetsp:Transcript_8133/g.17526  ORF Transcript_8133/g.17526 Transcript_8133/m.17526 type:complete len:201 (-) Transcript_8133:132-734(-)
MLNHCLILKILSRSLFRDINTIQKFTQIFVSDVGCLLDFGSGKRNGKNINSGQFNLILGIFRSDVFNSLGQRNLSYTTFSQKVADFDISTASADVDGEMRVDESHLVKESSGDTNNHVLNVRADGANTCELFTVGEPQVNLDVVLFDFFAFLSFHLGNQAAFHGNVLEVTFELTELSDNIDDAGLDSDRNSFRNFDTTGC